MVLKDKGISFFIWGILSEVSSNVIELRSDFGSGVVSIIISCLGFFNYVISLELV